MVSAGRRASSRPTLRAVADLAEVSISTASLVFSGRGPVAPATRARVEDAAHRLGYRGPDPLASSLRRGRAGVVAVIVEGRLLHAFHDPYAVSVLDGLARQLDLVPTGMLLVAADPARPGHTVSRLAATALDATVFVGCTPDMQPLVDHLAGRRIPMVALGAPEDPRVVQVRIDERAAMAGLARHVADLGHGRVAQVALPLHTDHDPLTRTTVGALLRRPYGALRGRLQGCMDVFGPDVPAVEARQPDVESGVAAAAVLFDGPGPRPTAVLAHSDLLAVGVIRAAQERGWCVPGDVTVTGFDGVDLPWWPQELTTVVQPGQGKGEAAGEAVRALLQGRRAADVTLPTRLRAGATACAPGS